MIEYITPALLVFILAFAIETRMKLAKLCGQFEERKKKWLNFFHKRVKKKESGLTKEIVHLDNLFLFGVQETKFVSCNPQVISSAKLESLRFLPCLLVFLSRLLGVRFFQHVRAYIYRYTHRW